jgi:hypothetical protein
MQLIYKALEKGFIKYLLKKNGTGFTKDNMTFSFHDLDGNAYYSFAKDVSLPVVRLGKLQEYYTWLSAGVTGEELEKMIEAADSALTNGLKDAKGMAKIGFILSELKDRKNMVLHPELYYNIIAAQVIRHDEKVNDWNNEIQMQKVEAFKEMDKYSDTFFLATHELLMQLNSLSITRQQLHDLLEESTLRIKAMKEMLQRA